MRHRSYFVYFDTASKTYAVESSCEPWLGTMQGYRYYFAGFARSYDATRFVDKLNEQLKGGGTREAAI